ncbi:hypothetical protein [Bacillus sp. B15-48]|uniref:hypothetical protein n=1 Tax=Bacillus sp. B15-48 TaxID=1548601 RepID=UPI00193EC618|nr:hypothetical protein [Bacillus sp. B15-48]
MDKSHLLKWIKKIQVKNKTNEDVEVKNESPLTMIGKGRQGAVFQLTDDICVKVFGNTDDCEREHYALSLGQHTKLFPKVYDKGTLHIAMEFIRGVDLREYLQSQPLTKELSVKLIEMLITFKEIGFERIDHHKRQIYLQKDGSLKVIDVARTVWRDRVYPYPRKLLKSLGEENKEVFLTHVKELSPALYDEWRHYIRMEEIAQEIYRVLLQSSDEKEKVVENLSDQLLTTADEEKYVVLMSGLMHKVFKEQWVRTMLARGEEPDEIMEKVKEYWDFREQEFKLGTSTFTIRNKAERRPARIQKGQMTEREKQREERRKWREKEKQREARRKARAESKKNGKSTKRKSTEIDEEESARLKEYKKWLTLGLI